MKRSARGLCEHIQRIAVIGGGFIGSEIAAALAMNGKQVVMLEITNNYQQSQALPERQPKFDVLGV